MALTSKEKKERLDWLVPIIRKAGKIVLSFYGNITKVDWKKPNEPVTAADHASNDFIIEQIEKAFPNDAILSEEAKENKNRFERDYTWIVDPMDGTKEFISRNGEFSVMIGLAEQGEPVLGTVYQPTEDRLYLGAPGLGATLDQGGSTTELKVSTRKDVSTFRLVVSRSHLEPVVDEIREKLGIENLHQSGSVGLKCGLIARSECDLYMHPSPHTKLWDSCAPQAILEAAGGVFTDMHGEKLNYLNEEVKNLNGMLVSNGAAHDKIVQILLHLPQ
ncbi:MAG: 3'(2'),5'-bisphosphate nucleotidase CysQ [bacterium]